jgi:hypothetical protein
MMVVVMMMIMEHECKWGDQKEEKGERGLQYVSYIRMKSGRTMEI